VDGRQTEVQERQDRQGNSLLKLVAVFVLAAVALAGTAGAARPADSSVLATNLKKSMQASYKKSVPGLVFTRVTCALPARATAGRCKAAFTIRPRRLKGVFTVSATVNRSSGGVRWRAVSAACTDTRTGKRVSC
jgi:hypothetical protein